MVYVNARPNQSLWQNWFARQILVERLSSLLDHEHPNNKTCQFLHYHVWSSLQQPASHAVSYKNARQRSPIRAMASPGIGNALSLFPKMFWQEVDLIIFPPIASNTFSSEKPSRTYNFTPWDFSSHQVLLFGAREYAAGEIWVICSMIIVLDGYSLWVGPRHIFVSLWTHLHAITLSDAIPFIHGFRFTNYVWFRRV